MLTIRNDQIIELRKCKDDKFVQKVKNFLIFNYAVRTSALTEKEIEQSIRLGMKRAKAYNLLSEKSMLAFIELMYTLTDDFDTNVNTKWTKSILSEYGLSESQKLNLIISKLNGV